MLQGVMAPHLLIEAHFPSSWSSLEGNLPFLGGMMDIVT